MATSVAGLVASVATVAITVSHVLRGWCASWSPRPSRLSILSLGPSSYFWIISFVCYSAPPLFLVTIASLALPLLRALLPLHLRLANPMSVGMILVLSIFYSHSRCLCRLGSQIFFIAFALFWNSLQSATCIGRFISWQPS
jgi:hypothetical protein